MKTFEIGQTVYMPDFSMEEFFVTCPDCLGAKYVTVTLGDGTEIKIECGGCEPGGYQPSTGVIKQYAYTASFRTHKVTGVKVSTTGVEYELDRTVESCSYYAGKQENVFATPDEALVAAEAKKLEREVEENKRLMSKTKDHRSWKWNAAYHMREIKRLEEQLEYHRSKASICYDNVKRKDKGDEQP